MIDDLRQYFSALWSTRVDASLPTDMGLLQSYGRSIRIPAGKLCDEMKKVLTIRDHRYDLIDSALKPNLEIARFYENHQSGISISGTMYHYVYTRRNSELGNSINRRPWANQLNIGPLHPALQSRSRLMRGIFRRHWSLKMRFPTAGFSNITKVIVHLAKRFPRATIAVVCKNKTERFEVRKRLLRQNLNRVIRDSTAGYQETEPEIQLMTLPEFASDNQWIHAICVHVDAIASMRARISPRRELQHLDIAFHSKQAFKRLNEIEKMKLVEVFGPEVLFRRTSTVRPPIVWNTGRLVSLTQKTPEPDKSWLWSKKHMSNILEVLNILRQHVAGSELIAELEMWRPDRIRLLVLADNVRQAKKICRCLNTKAIQTAEILDMERYKRFMSLESDAEQLVVATLTAAKMMRLGLFNVVINAAEPETSSADQIQKQITRQTSGQVLWIPSMLAR